MAQEEISGSTCTYKIRAMTSTHLDDQEFPCRVCSGYDVNCDKYLPISKTQIPIRRGRARAMLENLGYFDIHGDV